VALVKKIEGVYEFASTPLVDDRGEWHRVWDADVLSNFSEFIPIKQVSISTNTLLGTVRGIHYLRESALENKSVQCFHGSAFDVVVDMRKNSETYLDHVVTVLDSKIGNRVVIPPGCGHGFQTLEEHTSLAYTMTAKYDQKLELGVRFDDPRLEIEWPSAPTKISMKDLSWELLPENKSNP